MDEIYSILSFLESLKKNNDPFYFNEYMNIEGEFNISSFKEDMFDSTADLKYGVDTEGNCFKEYTDQRLGFLTYKERSVLISDEMRINIYHIFSDELVFVSSKTLYESIKTLLDKKFQDIYYTIEMKLCTLNQTSQEVFLSAILKAIKEFEFIADDEYYLLANLAGIEVNLLKNYIDTLKHFINKKSLNITSPIFNQIDEIEAENKFNGVPLAKVREHFQVLTRNPKPILSSEQLNLFINQAFKDYSPGKAIKEKISFNIQGQVRMYIMSIFHGFFELSCGLGSSVNDKRSYIKLLSDNFNGFDEEKLMRNFNKKPKKLLR
ncbi:hypothetical protein GVN16_03380 [Emticicia sp. CRIBPO]|uniref:hypothetical protein n=1 Tax=Emticicia sp. CRIBPO TaxID=2683258 RepID=UPI0014125D66|nr:hypothetical protein [Emticicia sp. CRIBPO]NBA84782.1 hypothetical protein [Emticicia sp. CRIBPO]